MDGLPVVPVGCADACVAAKMDNPNTPKMVGAGSLPIPWYDKQAAEKLAAVR